MDTEVPSKASEKVQDGDFIGEVTEGGKGSRHVINENQAPHAQIEHGTKENPSVGQGEEYTRSTLGQCACAFRK